MLLLTAVFLLAVETISPGLAVPDASTTSLVLPAEGGLNGAGPEEDAARSQGFGGGLLPAMENKCRVNNAQKEVTSGKNELVESKLFQ